MGQYCSGIASSKFCCKSERLENNINLVDMAAISLEYAFSKATQLFERGIKRIRHTPYVT